MQSNKTHSSFCDAFNATVRRYLDADMSLLGIDPDNPGQMPEEAPSKATGGVPRVNASHRTQKGIATRKAVYGETKLKPDTVKHMEARGDNVRKTKVEKRGATGRAN